MHVLLSSYFTLMLYGIANIGAILLMLACYKRPVMARFGLALLFGWASWFNATTVLSTPWVYSDFADYAVLDVYRWFILGPFDKLATPFILTIAAGQLFIAYAMLSTGGLFRIGCLAGIVFSIAILPLGVGAAFPAMVFLAIGFYQLWQRPDDGHLLKQPLPTARRRQLQVK